MTYYPVIIPTLCRYEHFRDCVESLAKNTHADKTELYIGLDYPAKESHWDGYNKIKEYIPTITGFKSVNVVYQTENKGQGKNNASLLELVFKKYDAWIGSEDDNVFSPCFLDYMNKCLEYFRDDESVIAVSGYSQDVNFSTTADIVMLSTYFSAWGCAFWKEKRERFTKSIYVGDYRKSVFDNPEKVKKIQKSFRVANHTLEWLKSMPHLNGGACDIAVESEMILQNKLCVFPKISLVRNMGNDGSGAHCGFDDKFAKQIIDERSEYLIDFSKTQNINKNDYELESYMLQSSFSKKEALQTKEKLGLILKYGLEKGEIIFEERQKKNSEKKWKKEETKNKIKATKFGKVLLAMKHFIKSDMSAKNNYKFAQGGGRLLAFQFTNIIKQPRSTPLRKAA